MWKKLLFTLICIFSVINVVVLTSCKKVKDFSDIQTIIYPSILKGEGNSANKYFVFIYGDVCTYCEELLPTVCEYVNLTKKQKDMIPLYVLNASNTRVNKGLVSSSDAEIKDFIATKNYEDIHIANTPALILVDDGMVTYYISSKTTQRPKTEIEQYLKKVMNNA